MSWRVASSFALGLIAFALASSTALAQKDPVLSQACSPFSGKAGETVIVTFSANGSLGGHRDLWSSCGAKFVWTSPQPTADGKPSKQLPDNKAMAAISLPEELPNGPIFFRIGCDKGMTQPVVFWIDNLPVVAETKENNAANTAVEIQKGVAIEGNTDSGRPDFYKFMLKAGENFSAEVIATRMLSSLDPVLRLTDATGKELAFADDTPGLGGDCRMRYTASTDGPVILEIHDLMFGGSGNHFYRLRVGDFSFDPKSQSNAETTNAARESEPNNQPDQAHVLMPRTTIQGDFSAAGDVDVFRFETKKGQRYRISSRMRSLGAAGNLYLRVEDEKAKLLAESDAAKSLEPELDFAANQDGTAYVIAEELNRKGGADFFYSLLIEPVTNSISLAGPNESSLTLKNGEASFKVTAQRINVKDAITLEVVRQDGLPLPSELKLLDNVIAQGKNETTLRIQLPKDFPADILPLTVVGRTQHDGQELTATMIMPPLSPQSKSPLRNLAVIPSVFQRTIFVVNAKGS